MEEMHYKQNLGVSQIKQIARNVPSRLDKEAKLCSNDRKRQIEREELATGTLVTTTRLPGLRHLANH